MKTLKSPFKTGTAKRKWYHILLLDPNSWDPYFEALKEQIENRGKVSKEVWNTEEEKEIVTKVEEILSDCCWGENFTFLPNDPWFIIGEAEVGDLSEIEAIMQIEEYYQINIDDTDIFEENFLFQDMINLIIKKRKISQRTDQH